MREQGRIKSFYFGLGVFGALAVTAMAAMVPARACAQAAAPPYEISVFAALPSNVSQPDSIVTWKDRVIVGFGNRVAKDGSDGKSSTIVEFESNGSVKRTFSVVGHNDGLRIVGENKLWALQNEDANPNLVVIDLESGTQTLYKFPLPTPHGGGYDDIVVLDGNVYLTASNPSATTFPALVQASLSGKMVVLKSILMGNAAAIDIPTGLPVILSLSDPDSMTKDLNGDIVFTSQADSVLVFVKHPGTAAQTVGHLAISSPDYVGLTIDDTAYAPPDSAYLLVTDIGDTVNNGAIYRITRANFGFDTGQPYSASDSNGIVGTLNVDNGVITTAVSGLLSARGLTFVRKESVDQDDQHGDERGD